MKFSIIYEGEDYRATQKRSCLRLDDIDPLYMTVESFLKQVFNKIAQSLPSGENLNNITF